MQDNNMLRYAIGSNGETLDRIRKGSQPVHLTQQQETLHDTLLIEGPVDVVIRVLHEMMSLAKDFKRSRKR